MAKEAVCLDALIKREDFECVDTPNAYGRTESPFMKISELEDKSNWFRSLRKPDFQRETSSWSAEAICDLVLSFVDREFIPALVVWGSSQSNNIFVIDGAHRLSALIAWVHDDYGDGKFSKEFFKTIPPEQVDAAQKTRDLIEKKIGKYSVVATALSDGTTDPVLQQRAAAQGNHPLMLQWVQGTPEVAERSFFKINQKAQPIKEQEIKIIQARRRPNAIAARAILHAGSGHKYWSAFAEEKRLTIESIALDIYNTLFLPFMNDPIKTLDLPVAGRGYSASALSLIFHLVNLANEVNERGKKKAQPQNDETGDETIVYLKRVRSVARLLASPDECSLGLALTSKQRKKAAKEAKNAIPTDAKYKSSVRRAERAAKLAAIERIKELDRMTLAEIRRQVKARQAK